MRSSITKHPSLAFLERNKRENHFSDLTPMPSDLYSKTEVPIDCTLHRVDILTLDRSKLARGFINRYHGSGVSYLYDSLTPKPGPLSPVVDRAMYPLPLEVSELEALLLSDTYKPENIFKRAKASRPYGRSDALNLSSWLEDMHKKFLPRLDHIIQSNDPMNIEMSQIIEPIYLVALKETIKQVAVNCLERGVLLQKIFEILSFTWKKIPDDLLKKIDTLQVRHVQELEYQHTKFGRKINKLKKKVDELTSKISESSKEKDVLKNETGILKRQITKISTENEIKKVGLKLKILKKNSNDVEVQTDLDPPSDSEEECTSSSECEENNNSMYSPITRVMSRQQTMVDKYPEHIFHLKKHLDLAGCADKVEIEELYKYITTDFCDFYGWVDGFRLASEILKVREVEKIPEVVESLEQDGEKKEAEETNERSPRRKEPKPVLRQDFKFKPNITIAQYITENSPIEHILLYLEGLSNKKIAKISNMASKKLSNTISNYITAARLKNYEQYSSFSIFVYSILFQKYSLKPLANRKFKELIASCIKHINAPQVEIFLRMIGGGKSLNYNSFWHTTSKICINTYDFMLTDKSGIVVENLNQIDNLDFPAVRAYECIRQIFEPLFVRSDIMNLKRKVEALSFVDPDDLNKSGLINLHQFVLVAIEAFQEYSEKVSKGVHMVTSIITDYKYLTWGEASVLLRNIHPHKDTKDFDKSIMQMNECQEMDIDKFEIFCIKYGLLRIEDCNRFFSKPAPSQNQIFDKIYEMRDRLPEVIERCEKFISTLSAEEWDAKLDDILIRLKGKSNDAVIKMWVLLWSEYQYILNKINT